jgi:hypothetical protein
MELDEFKNAWKAEGENLESKIKLNENLLIKIKMESATGEFNKLLSQSLLGRNLALVYCLISLAMAIKVIEEFAYSLPAILGSFAMLWSFISHLSIEKPDYMGSVIKLQKTICKFRVHMAANAKYDISIAALWMLTFVPVFLKSISNISFYSDPKVLSVFCLISVVVLTLMIVLSRKTYKENTRKLKQTEAYLAELIEFEKN